MLKRIAPILAVILLIASAVGCAQVEPTPSPTPVETAALTITGSVAAVHEWTVAELRTMPQTSTDYVNKEGETETYTGVALSALFDEAGCGAEATTIAFVAGDGYSAEGDLAEVRGVENGIVAIADDGSLRVVLPEMSSKLQVKDLVEIKLK